MFLDVHYESTSSNISEKFDGIVELLCSLALPFLGQGRDGIALQVNADGSEGDELASDLQASNTCHCDLPEKLKEKKDMHIELRHCIKSPPTCATEEMGLGGARRRDKPRESDAMDVHLGCSDCNCCCCFFSHF